MLDAHFSLHELDLNSPSLTNMMHNIFSIPSEHSTSNGQGAAPSVPDMDNHTATGDGGDGFVLSDFGLDSPSTWFDLPKASPALLVKGRAGTPSTPSVHVLAATTHTLGLADKIKSEESAPAPFAMVPGAVPGSLAMATLRANPPPPATTPPPSATPPQTKYSPEEREVLVLVPKEVLRGTKEAYSQHRRGMAVALTPPQNRVLSKLRRRELAAVYSDRKRRAARQKNASVLAERDGFRACNVTLEAENTLLREQLQQLRAQIQAQATSTGGTAPTTPR